MPTGVRRRYCCTRCGHEYHVRSEEVDADGAILPSEKAPPSILTKVFARCITDAEMDEARDGILPP